MSFVIDRLKEIESVTTIQGNIASGKTYLINEIETQINDMNLSALNQSTLAPPGGENGRDLFLILHEPVARWCEKTCSLLNVNDEGEDGELYSFLELFYKGMKTEGTLNEYALPFQLNTFSTRAENICTQIDRLPRFDPTSNTRIHIISERSLRTDRVFFKNVYDSGAVAKYQWDVYEQLYRNVCGATLKSEDTMIRIDTSAEKCHERMYKKRQRDAEVSNGVSLDYLQSLECQHNQMYASFVAEKGVDSLVNVNFEQDMTREEVANLARGIIASIVQTRRK